LALEEDSVAIEESLAQEKAFDARIARTLFVGLVASIAIMVAGLVLAAAHGHNAVQHVLPLADVPSHLAQGDPASVLDLGILLLFATPLAGVLVAAAQFAQERDRQFLAISLMLLCVLCVGFIVGLRGL